MRDVHSDDYESVAGDADTRLIPETVRRVAGAAVFVGLVVAMGLWSWRLGTRDATEVPIIRAMEGPTRVQPADPGGKVAAHQGLEVNNVLAGVDAPAPRATLPPEPPPALAEEDAPPAELVVTAPDFSGEAIEDLEADVETEVPPPGDGEGLAEAVPAAELTHAATIEALVAAAQDEAAVGPRPKGRPQDLARPASAPVLAAASKPAPAAAVPKEVATLAPGARMVQLGAYDSEAITRAAWSRLVAANPDLLGSKSLYLERATSSARVFYRLRVAGFDSAEETRVLCEALRGRGTDCIPVTRQ